MRLEKMSSKMRKLKLVVGVVSAIALGGIISCGQQFAEPFDSEEQLAIDVELIEAYLADKGYTDYDTLDGDIRIVVLDEGSGDAIEFNDLVSFHYIGRFLNDTIFDTSIPKLAYDQDTATALKPIYFELDDFDEIVLDKYGFATIDSINYAGNYSPIYSPLRTYSAYKTTHSPGGWAAYQALTGLITGFAPSAVFTLENVNLGGRVVAFMPSSQAYGRFGSGRIAPNTVLAFEFRPVTKR